MQALTNQLQNLGSTATSERMEESSPYSTTHPQPSSKPDSASSSPEKAEAEEYLQSLINKTFHVLVTDGRLFVGTFKCTDTDSNIVLAHTHEYRQPSAQKVAEAAAAAAASSGSGKGTFKADMTSRFLGMVVIPGEHIIKLEVQEYVSQMGRGGGRSPMWDRRDV
ncbi:hypothetical protein F5Y17DRAFT_461923 [Xylariaceae sp. FL0594]|nr:hypothetical protein F5Y17DRAFT_461923 [Xylariaceae sp. FL0594]